MTIHLLGLPHTETTTEFEWCAYTAKTRKMASMLTDAGERVILYAGEVNEARVAEHVQLVSREEQARWYGHYDWKRDTFGEFDPASEGWRTMNDRAVAEIRARAQPGDILGLTMGWSQHEVAWRTADLAMLQVEVGVGYPGVFAPYRVYESWAWRHYLATREPTDDIRAFDTVIPNFFEVDAFPAGSGSGGYFLYIGRLIARKGPHIAAETCRRLGARLVVAGQGMASVQPGRITATDGTVIEGDVEYVGVVGPEERAELMGEAIAAFIPTTYLEPFGGVSVEAQMTGTPAIVSDWGGLRENVEPGWSGFHCSTLSDYVRAAQNAPYLDRGWIRDHARSTWSTAVIAPRYLAYFEKLRTLYGAGWYELAA